MMFYKSDWNELFTYPAVASFPLITGPTPAEKSLCAIQIILSHWMYCCIPHASQKMYKKNKEKNEMLFYENKKCYFVSVRP